MMTLKRGIGWNVHSGPALSKRAAAAAVDTHRRRSYPPPSMARPLLLSLLLASTISLGSPVKWDPPEEFKTRWDWIQMTSGEWVKGEILQMYDERLEFDSDEFDDLVLEWEDIRQIHTSRYMNVGLIGRRSASGKLHLVDNVVTLTFGEEVTKFAKREVLTLTARHPEGDQLLDLRALLRHRLSRGQHRGRRSECRDPHRAAHRAETASPSSTSPTATTPTDRGSPTTSGPTSSGPAT